MSRKGGGEVQNHSSSAPGDWIILNRKNGSKIPLNSQEMVFVGKSDCDIVLNSSSVDQRHAVISFSPQDGIFYIKDLNTSHGTFVNDWKIPGQTYIKLENSNNLRFGFSSDTFTICKSSSLASTSSSPQAASSATPSPSPATRSNSIPTNVVQPKLIHPQPLSDRDESPALLRQKYAKKHHNSTIFPLPFCSEDYKPPVKPPTAIKKKAADQAEGQQQLLQNTDLYESPADASSSNSQQIEETTATNAAEANCTLPPQASSTVQAPVQVAANPEVPKNQKSSKKMSIARPVMAPEEPVVKIPPAPPTAFTISFDDETPKKPLPPRLSSALRSRAEEKESKNKNQKRDSSNNRRESSCSGRRSNSSNSRRDVDSNRRGSDSQLKTSPVSESAAFLIQRMLDSGSDRAQSPSASEQGLDSGVCDDRSECGTYTLTSEKKDADVEQARKMIDDVFGIKDYVKQNQISPDSSPEHSLEAASQTGTRTFTRKKPESDLMTRSEHVSSSGSKTRGRDAMTRSAIESPIMRRRCDSSSSTRSASSSRTVELKKTSSPLLSRRPFHNRSKSNLSVASNDSEPFSINSTNYKSDSNASTLKFNRAFALRRARLGIETPGVPLNLSSEKPPKVPVEQRLSRADGGRFSLRAGKSSTTLSVASSSSRKSSQDQRHSVSGQVRPKTCSDTERAFRCLNESVNRSLLKSRQLVSDSEHNLSRSFTSTPRSSVGRQLVSSGSSRNKQQANVAPIKRSDHEVMMSSSMIEPRNPSSETTMVHGRTVKPTRVMSALDNLVLAAVLQLSGKLKRGMREFLEKEHQKYPLGSDTRMMIEEILPQVGADDTRLPDNSSESPSKELSNILKNLKKVEQSLEVLTLLADVEPSRDGNRCYSLEM